MSEPTIPIAAPENFRDLNLDGIGVARELMVESRTSFTVGLIDDGGNAFERSLRLEARAAGRDLEQFLLASWRAERARRFEAKVTP